MSGRSNRTGLVLVGLISLTSCMTYRSHPVQDIAPGATVQIRLLHPDTVIFRSSSGDALLAMPDVSEVRGRVSEKHGDSIRVLASDVTRSDGATQRLGAGASADFHLADLGVVEKRETHVGRTVGIVLLVGLAGLLLLAMIAVATAPEPEPVEKDDPKAPSYGLW